jgi:hypothetical protein
MMDIPKSTCSHAAIERFLADQLFGQELSDFEDHLEHCPSCRESLDNLAAEGRWWDEARLYLSADDVGPVSNRPVLLPVEIRHHESDDETEQSLFGLKGYLAPTDDPRMLGRLGPYEIAGIIGCGGMGIVLKGFDAPLNRYVAIKVLGPHLALKPVSRQRFAREAKAAATVVNPNVIAIHSVAEANGLPYFVMPYVRGPSLEKRLREAGAFSVVEILRIGMQVASGLAAAHAQGVVHRDIKPANIMLEEGIERVTITDFGLARVADEAGMTQSGVVAGTPQYMSPEQARGDAVDPRSDLFSLGSVLYALCTGQPPFQSSTTMGVLKRVEDCRPRPVRALNPDIPLLLAQIIERLHAKDPAERFQSAAELAGLLESYLAHLGQPETVAAPEMAAARKRTGRRLIRRLFAFKPGLLILIALGLGSAAWFAGSPPQKKYAQEYYQAFSGKPNDIENYEFRGGDTEKQVAFEADGLRINLIPGYPGGRPGVGLSLLALIKGDFEITANFEILQEPKRSDSRGTRVTLGVLVNESARIDGSISHRINGQGNRQFFTYLAKPNTPAAQHFFNTDAKSGQLRLVRTDTVLSFLSSPTDSEEFTLLKEYPFTTNDLKTVFLEASTNDPKDLVDVRITNLRVRAAAIQTGKAPLPRKGGLAAILLVGLVVTMFSILALWLILRWRRSKETATPPTLEAEESNQTSAPNAAGERKTPFVNRPRRLVSLLVVSLVLAISGVTAGVWFAGCWAEPALNEATEFHHDFRGQPLPPELGLFQVDDKNLVQVEPEGLRIKISETWISPPWGIGIKTAFGLKGDFEATVAFEMIRSDIPPKSRIGLALGLFPVNNGKGKNNAATGIDRFVAANGAEGIRWWSSKLSQNGEVPNSDKVGRFRLKRTGTMLRYLWAAGLEGDDFQEIGQSEWSDDVEHIRVYLFTTQNPATWICVCSIFGFEAWSPRPRRLKAR